MSFADRPYRTFDSIPVAQFFNYTLVQDFFAGPNPPNAIIAGELPSDIALNKLDSASEQGGGTQAPCHRLHLYPFIHLRSRFNFDSVHALNTVQARDTDV